MFFYIGKDCPITSLNKINDKLYLDNGWSVVDGGLIYYKGYSTECNIKDNLLNIINGAKYQGKYCVIYNNQIYYPLLRGFPLYQNNDVITNLPLANFEYVNQEYVPYTAMLSETLSIVEASKQIGNILLENIKNFYQYTDVDVMNVLCSAGLDTTTVWAVLDSFTKQYILNGYVPKANETTLQEFLGVQREYKNDLTNILDSNFWGYNVCSFYKHKNYYITGYYAEMIQFRDAEAINAIARYLNKTIDTLANSQDYLYHFLKRPNVVEKYSTKYHNFKNEIELKEFLYNTIFVDHQMWHLDNNINFSPFFDIRIPNVMLNLSIDDIAYNSVSGIIQKNIIQQYKSDLLSIVSDYKNTKPVWKNFKENFNAVDLTSILKNNIR